MFDGFCYYFGGVVIKPCNYFTIIKLNVDIVYLMNCFIVSCFIQIIGFQMKARHLTSFMGEIISEVEHHGLGIEEGDPSNFTEISA